MQTQSFKNHFLVAMPGLEDPGFHQTVTFICEHNEGGAMGLIINQPITLTVGELFKQLGITLPCQGICDQPLHYGGPVQQERGFVLHSQDDKNWESTVAVSKDVAITGSADIFEDMSNGEGPEHALIALGYAGWDAGQLETEISENSWLTVEGDADILFKTDYKSRWTHAAQKLGVDLTLMSGQSGHA